MVYFLALIVLPTMKLLSKAASPMLSFHAMLSPAARLRLPFIHIEPLAVRQSFKLVDDQPLLRILMQSVQVALSLCWE